MSHGELLKTIKKTLCNGGIHVSDGGSLANLEKANLNCGIYMSHGEIRKPQSLDLFHGGIRMGESKLQRIICFGQVAVPEGVFSCF